MQVEVCGVQREVEYQIRASYLNGEPEYWSICAYARWLGWYTVASRYTIQEIVALLPEEHR
jgi:hypothetical protein